jgi:hypothetical protein
MIRLYNALGDAYDFTEEEYAQQFEPLEQAESRAKRLQELARQYDEEDEHDRAK